MVEIYYMADTLTMKKMMKYIKRGKLGGLKMKPIYSDDIMVSDKGRFRDVGEEKAVLIWGHGGEHHVSYFFSPPEGILYEKSVDDAHDDLMDLERQGIHCANHNTALTMKDRNLKGIEILGLTKNLYRSGRNISHARKTIPHIKLDSSMKTELSGKYPVHKSIDLDVIHGFSCTPAFRIGRQRAETVIESFEKVLNDNEVIRFDLGGLTFSDLEPYKKPTETEMRDIKIYEYLIELYLEANSSMV